MLDAECWMLEARYWIPTSSVEHRVSGVKEGGNIRHIPMNMDRANHNLRRP